jgi:hypothetical protein
VKENVGLGNVEKIGYKPAIEAAVHLAEADTLVQSLPNGLKTMLETPGFESMSYPGMTNNSGLSTRHGLSGGEVCVCSMFRISCSNSLAVTEVATNSIGSGIYES